MIFLRVIFLTLLVFAGCTNSSLPKPSLDQVIYNKASMTKTLKSLDNNLSVEILKTGVQGDNYVRIIALKLSNTPVIAAISQTNLQNKLFKDIIANADTTPIGTKLFTPNSSIKRRDDMLIRKIKLSSIKNPVVTAYLSKLGYTDNDLIIERYSIFYYQQQTLDLIEYILPSIDKFVNH